MGLALALSVCGTLSAQDEPALAAYWDFNDASNPDETLDKLFGFQGALEEGASFTTGQSGNAIDFGTTSAGQRIFINEVSFLNMAAARDQVSISFWQSLHNVANSSAFWGGSPSSTGSERGIQAHTPWGDGNIYFDTAGCCDAGTQRISGNVIAFEPDFATGWHHLVFIKNGSTKQVWVNGQLFLEGNNTLPLPVDFNRLVIGADLGGGNSIQGIIDDFAVFIGVLSPANIAQLAAGIPPDELDGVDVLTDPIVSAAISSATGFTVTITDSRSAAVDPDSIGVLLDGQAISPTVAKVGNRTTIHYNVFDEQGVFFTSGASYPLSISLQTTAGDPFTSEQTFTVAPFATIPAAYALAAPPTTPGFVVTRVHQMTDPRSPNENSIPTAEMQLAGGMVDATGNPRPNIAEDAGPIPIGGANTGSFLWTPYVNWEQSGGAVAIADNFNVNEPAGEPGTIAGAYANEFFPGVEPIGFPPDPNNFVTETVAYVQLDRGLHRWGVNSDDGFKVTAGPGHPSPFGLTLGQFDGGRGASDTIFDFVVETTGHYPIRLLHWEGQGGASCEWFSVDIETGQKILIGDTDFYPTAAYQAFRTGQGRARVSNLRPSSGFAGTAPTGPVFVQIDDGRTIATNARLYIDGEQVATGTKAGTVTTIDYTPTTPWEFGSSHTGQIVYEESTIGDVTHNFTFQIRQFTIVDLPADSFTIDATHFDNNGQSLILTGANYDQELYRGIGAVHNVDYFESGNEPTALGAFRSGELNPNVPTSSLTGAAEIARPGGWTVSPTYSIGWTSSGEWLNYTRNVPAGIYTAMARLSHGDAGANVGGNIRLVTGGVGTTEQTLGPIFGQFAGPAPGGWGTGTLVPLRTAATFDAPTAYFKMPGGQVTIRFTKRNGDFHWFTLVPVTGAIPPVVQVIAPANAHSVFRDAGRVQLRIEEFTTQVNESGISMTFDGQAVTPSFAKLGDIITVTYDHAGLLEIGREYPFSVTITDNATPPNIQTVEGTLLGHYMPASPEGMFLIEAEDFNTDGGNTVAAASTMPYLGNAYAGLSAVAGIDYQRDNVTNNFGIYRNADLNPAVPMGANEGAMDDPIQVYDLVRAMDANRNVTWEMDVNFSLGWAGSHWFNYTRNIPNGTYQVWAAMSHGETGAGQLSASLHRLIGPANVPGAEQQLEALGVFSAPGTGGWGNNRLVPLRDATSNAVKEVNLGGNTTLRYNWASGDWDYMMLVPTAIAPPGLVVAIELQTDGMLRIQWEGDGVLQRATSIPSVEWTNLPDTSPAVIEPPATGNVFFRVQE
jgi:hypothetical protein